MLSPKKPFCRNSSLLGPVLRKPKLSIELFVCSATQILNWSYILDMLLEIVRESNGLVWFGVVPIIIWLGLELVSGIMVEVAASLSPVNPCGISLPEVARSL